MNASKTFRSDGLDNPLSPNSGRLTFADIESQCEESAAVKSYRTTGDGIEITWCDGNVETFRDAIPAASAIRAMEAN